jgi:hypothetical protein
MAEDQDIMRARQARELAKKLAEQRAAAASTPAIDPYYVRDPKTGLSPAQVEAQAALQDAQATNAALGIPSRIVNTAGSAGSISTPPAEGLKTGYEWYAFNLPGGGFEWRQRPTKELLSGAYNTLFGSSSGSAGGGGGGGGGKTVTGTYTDPTTGDIYYVYSDGSRVLQTKGTKIADAALAAQQAAAAAAESKRRQGQSAYDLLFSEFDRYGLGALVAPLQGFIVEGLSPAEFTLRLRQTDAYQKRFAANQARIKAGLRALSEAEYIGLEDQYQNVMRNYGLPASYYTKGDMGVQQGFEKFIAGDVSAAELEDRIQTAQNRVINANPEVSKALREFFPEVTNGDILAYVLDPENSLGTIKRKVTISEIGGAAFESALKSDVTRASELAKYGVTGQAYRQAAPTIRQAAERGSQLASFFKETPYTQQTAESMALGVEDAASAIERTRKLTEKERALYSGSSGAAQGALARERAGQF